jgi:prevent-host-death family protein
VGNQGRRRAKTHLAALLDRVAKGEKIAITRRGIPAAVLVPVVEKEAKLSLQEIVAGMQALRQRVKPDEMRAKDMIEECRWC